MNKLVILISLLVMGLFFGDAFALNAPAMQGGVPERHYIEVEFNPQTGQRQTASHGVVMEWDLEADSNETLGYTVHILDGDSEEAFAGAVPAWNDYSHNLDTLGRALIDGDVFLMQIYGEHDAVNCDGSITESQGVAGDAATAGVKDGDGFGFALDGHRTRDTTNRECDTSTCAQIFIRPGEAE